MLERTEENARGARIAPEGNVVVVVILFFIYFNWIFYTTCLKVRFFILNVSVGENIMNMTYPSFCLNNIHKHPRSKIKINKTN